MKLKTIFQLLTIIVVMLLNYYPITELTRVINEYAEIYAGHNILLQSELVWCMWIPYFSTPVLLAVVFYTLNRWRDDGLV